MDTLAFVAMASVIAAGFCMGIGAIGPALGEGRALSTARWQSLNSLMKPIPSLAPCLWVWLWWNQPVSTVS
jgi:hypothetical protein